MIYQDGIYFRINTWRCQCVQSLPGSGADEKPTNNIPAAQARICKAVLEIRHDKMGDVYPWPPHGIDFCRPNWECSPCRNVQSRRKSGIWRARGIDELHDGLCGSNIEESLGIDRRARAHLVSFVNDWGFIVSSHSLTLLLSFYVESNAILIFIYYHQRLSGQLATYFFSAPEP